MTDESPGISNAVHPDTIKRFVGELLRCEDELASEQGVYMSRCKGIRERMKEIKDRAKDSGLPRKVLSKTMKRIGLEKDLEGLGDDLESDDLDLFEYVTEVLGDFGKTPLGEAAAHAAAAGAAQPANDDAPKTGRQKRARARSDAADSLTEDEPDKDAAAAAANVVALAGLKQLN